MKKIILSLFLSISCWGMLVHAQPAELSYENPYISTRERLLNRDEGSVMVVAHRADWRHFPENSLAAIRSAIAMGVDIIELDVQRTKDSVLILMHDRSLDRTTTGTGNVAETDYEVVRTLYLQSGASTPTTERVPTLEEALIEIKGKVMVNLDKADRFFDEVYQLLQKTSTIDQVIMKGSKPAPEVSATYGSYLDDLLYMPIVRIDEPDAIHRIEQYMNELNPVAFELVYRDTTHRMAEEISGILKGKSLVWYNTLWASLAGGLTDDRAVADPDAVYGYLVDRLGARIIQTDRPALLLEYLNTRDLPKDETK